MRNDNGIYGLNIFSAILTAIQTEHVFQIISLVLTCLATTLSILFTIWKWWKKAKADGKITDEEVDELMNEINKDLEKEKGEKK